MTPTTTQTIVTCYQCGRPCPESLADGTDSAAGTEARARAVAAGWARVELEDYEARKPSRVVRMYCPGCEGVGAEAKA